MFGVLLHVPLHALARQFALPGCVGFSVLSEDGPVALAVVYVSGDDATVHAMAGLGADEGRAESESEVPGARYALVQAIVGDMAGRGLRALDLGASDADPAFMEGWTEDVRPSYRCGRVVDRMAYDELVASAGTAGHVSFPAYRAPASRLRA